MKEGSKKLTNKTKVLKRDASTFSLLLGHCTRTMGSKVFSFGIAKILATTKIIEFHEIRRKFRRNCFRD